MLTTPSNTFTYIHELGRYGIFMTYTEPVHQLHVSVGVASGCGQWK